MHSNPLLNCWYKFKALKTPLKQLNTRHYQGTTSRLQNLGGDLIFTQDQLAHDYLNSSLIET